MPPRLRSRARPSGRHLTDTAVADSSSGHPRRARISALALATIMMVAGILHFVLPHSYQRIVPRFLGHAPGLVVASGVAEIIAGGLVGIPRTRRLGAAGVFAILLLVWPANVQMALDGRLADAGFPAGPAVVAWLRVPLQVPLLIWAWRLYRAPRQAEGRSTRST